MVTNLLPAGKYWVGDLCYVLSSYQWEQVCEQLEKQEFNDSFTRGARILEIDGIKIAISNTAYGDGDYIDQIGRKYSVDSGTIGCILDTNISHPDGILLMNLGNVVEFPEDFAVRYIYDNGNILFGDVVTIDTAGEWEDEYEDNEDIDGFDEEEDEEEDRSW